MSVCFSPFAGLELGDADRRAAARLDLHLALAGAGERQLVGAGGHDDEVLATGALRGSRGAVHPLALGVEADLATLGVGQHQMGRRVRGEGHRVAVALQAPAKPLADRQRPAQEAAWVGTDDRDRVACRPRLERRHSGDPAGESGEEEIVEHVGLVGRQERPEAGLGGRRAELEEGEAALPTRGHRHGVDAREGVAGIPREAPRYSSTAAWLAKKGSPSPEARLSSARISGSL